MNPETCIVTVWSHSSESTIFYGPFRTLDAAERFCDKVDDVNGYEVKGISPLNSSKLFGTGFELVS